MGPVKADMETGSVRGDVLRESVTTEAADDGSLRVRSVPHLQVSLLVGAVGRVTGKIQHVDLEADSVLTSRSLQHPLARLPVQPPSRVIRRREDAFPFRHDGCATTSREVGLETFGGDRAVSFHANIHLVAGGADDGGTGELLAAVEEEQGCLRRVSVIERHIVEAAV